MKKLTQLKNSSIFLLLFILSSFYSLGQFGKCTNGVHSLTYVETITYMKNYQALVSSFGTKAAWQYVGLTKNEISCLSSKIDSMKFIAGSSSPTKIDKITTIAELCKNGNCVYYDIDVLFPTFRKTKIGKKIAAGHTCPPPDNCGIPLAP